MKTRMSITVVGRDRDGVVAAFTRFVFKKQGNIEKIDQNVIRGLFGMYLEVSFAKKPDVAGFNRGLQRLAGRYGMDVDAHHESSSKKNVAIFVTKEPHCLDALLKNRARLNGRIAVVVGTEDILEPLAKKAHVPFVTVRARTQEASEKELLDICRRYDTSLILLARYMRILTPNFVWRYPNRIINIHPSLLPAFPGATAYMQAFERGAKIVGVTSHYVTENLDQGPIILQDGFRVRSSDSLESIKRRGQKLEAKTLLKAATMHLDGMLEVNWKKVHARQGTA